MKSALVQSQSSGSLKRLSRREPAGLREQWRELPRFVQWVISWAIVTWTYLAVTSPASVRPPAVPHESGLRRLASWPSFRFGLVAHEVFAWLADATKPPRQKAVDLALNYRTSVVAYGLAYHRIVDAIPYDVSLGTSSWVGGVSGNTVVEGGSSSSSSSRRGGAACEDVARKRRLKVDFACRFMRAGVGVGLLRRSERSGNYTTTRAGDLLRKAHPESIRDLAIAMNAETREAWYAAAESSLTSGKSGFYEAFGADAPDWRKRHATEWRRDDRARSAYQRPTSTAVVGDFRLNTGAETVCDLGGGRGELLRDLAEHWPETHLILFDLPETIPRAVDYLGARVGAERFSALGGSFLANALPVALQTCDLFVLKDVLRDFPDDQCVKILSNVRKVAKKKGAKLLIVDVLLDDGAYGFDNAKRLDDLHQLATAPPGAKHRNLTEVKHILDKANLLNHPNGHDDDDDAKKKNNKNTQKKKQKRHTNNRQQREVRLTLKQTRSPASLIILPLNT
eukprot:CAMPEP_0118910210 /NCGR_PEP_ID=MMETSP1166-20130328/12449_1 /TAXON_ID=1104430 /ORGANISM="Chrysoreinhardia sp, Strain CCMP3193" /LENGTH=508 /DNA_ID=CAMNT_0006849669 /DNA_START=12 /DNA_END=1538 /DNA_ORIENTATION=-